MKSLTVSTLETSASRRVKANGKSTPWSQADKSKSDLLKKLKEAEQQQDFYSGLYRQYTTNLLKLVIYLRSLISNPTARQYLQSRHPQQLQAFEEIVNSTEQ